MLLLRNASKLFFMQFRLSWTVPWNKNCRLISSMYSRRHMKDIALKRPWVNIKTRWEECVPAVLMGTLWQSCRWGFLYCMPFVASVEGNTLIDLWPSMDWEHQCLSIFEEAENKEQHKVKEQMALYSILASYASLHQSFKDVLVLNKHLACCCCIMLGIHFWNPKRPNGY